MKAWIVAGLALGLAACGVLAHTAKVDQTHLVEAPLDGGKFYSYTVSDIDGNQHSLGEFKGKVLLVVNVASKCGNTPQDKGLEATFKKYKDQGFEVLGFPANDFASQEPGTNAEIKQFCSLTYDVNFPMFSKITVKGDGMAPLYQYLTKETEYPGDISWNFEKFLVNRQGRVVARFSPRMTVDTPAVVESIEAALQGPQ